MSNKHKTKPRSTPSQGPDGLNLRQLRFCTEYMRSGNGTEAAKRAGYAAASAHVQAHDLLNNPKIKEHIAKAWAAVAMSEQEIIGRLSEQARADVSEFLTQAGNVSMSRVKQKGHLLRRVKRTAAGALEVETHDPQTALGHLAKIRGLFHESVTLTGSATAEPVKLEFAHPAGEVVHQ